MEFSQNPTDPQSNARSRVSLASLACFISLLKLHDEKGTKFEILRYNDFLCAFLVWSPSRDEGIACLVVC